VGTPVSYLLCGTPRTGSTLLCSLLTSTGVLGRPESYFREADEAAWAARFGLPTDGPQVRNHSAFVQAVRREATSDNGVFAARVMWGSLDRLLSGLGQHPDDSDLVTLQRAFGPLAFVHLSRTDVVAQAVSWCRAEQTGFWQDGDVAVRPPEEDLERMVALVGTIRDHDSAWQAWFDRHAVRPYAVTYEGLVRDLRGTVLGIARHLGVELPRQWRPVSPHRQQADATNDRWAAVLRAELRT
jgi:trehalose 2-sulfotransferase